MRLKSKEAVVGYAFIIPSLSGFGLLYFIPFLSSIYYCFTRGISNTEFVGLQNFKELFRSNSFLLALKNTMSFNMISIPSIILLSFVFALLLKSMVRGKPLFSSFFAIPLVVPIASVILVWQLLFNDYGFLNRILHMLNLEPVDWLGSKWSLLVVTVVYLWKNCGYNVILFTAGLAGIPREYYESAAIDGASKFTCLTKITIPLLLPTEFFVFIMSIINSFKVFREVYLLAGDYPGQDIYMLQHFMNNNFFNLNYPRLTTAASITFIFIFMLVFVVFRAEARFGKNF